MGKLLNRILVSRLLISSFPGSASIMHVESPGKTVFSTKLFPFLIDFGTSTLFLVDGIFHSAAVIQNKVWRIYYICASTQQNLSLGLLRKGDSSQSPQLRRLARKLKFHL